MLSIEVIDFNPLTLHDKIQYYIMEALGRYGADSCAESELYPPDAGCYLQLIPTVIGQDNVDSSCLTT